MPKLVIGVALAGFVGCATPQDIRTSIGSTMLPHANTGSITLLLTHPSDSVIVAVNGQAVVEHAYTGRVHIDGLQAGWNEIEVAAGTFEKTTSVYVEPGRDRAIPMATESDTSFVEAIGVDVAGSLLKVLLGRFL